MEKVLLLLFVASVALAGDIRPELHDSPKTRDGFALHLNDLSKLTKCQMHREMSLNAPPVLMFDIWIPECNMFNGHYLPGQCTNDGRCFCVDRVGATIDGTETTGQPKCPSVKGDNRLSHLANWPL
ncbi:PREDICTED: nidogen-1-like [Priapulus caudatus]|uniref:Nidogen-1-like n=1 Tax=Priapulus caudatus TaxID=37621 RepID=A0ABM1EKN6_PRICU|nr:PREDICTED: nidogen-1-like [Priapulus caudatus]